MKGMQLPVNMIIIISVAVLVMLVVASFFTGQTSFGFSSISSEKQLAFACNTLHSQYACDQSSVGEVYVDDGNSRFYLANLCREKGAVYEGDCASLCGCKSNNQGGEIGEIIDRGNPGVVMVDVYSQA